MYNELFLGVKMRLLRFQFGERLGRKVNQREMAFEINLSYFTYQSLEEGRRQNPHLQTIIKIANFYRISIDELIGRM